MAENWVVVTGGTRGIGRAVSMELLKKGWGVHAIYKERDEEAKKLAVDALKINPTAPLKIHKIDVAQKEEVEKFFGNIKERVVALVNNAAIQRPPNNSHENLLEIFAANVLGPYYLMLAFDEYRREAGLNNEVGAIVSISSTSALRGPSGHAIYASSKAAFHRMSTLLAPQFAREKLLNVNMVTPGVIDAGNLSPKSIERNLAQTPSRKITTPEDTAKVAVWLIENRHLNIVGASINVDGGRIL